MWVSERVRAHWAKAFWEQNPSRLIFRPPVQFFFLSRSPPSPLIYFSTIESNTVTPIWNWWNSNTIITFWKRVQVHTKSSFSFICKLTILAVLFLLESKTNFVEVRRITLWLKFMNIFFCQISTVTVNDQQYPCLLLWATKKWSQNHALDTVSCSLLYWFSLKQPISAFTLSHH